MINMTINKLKPAILANVMSYETGLNNQLEQFYTAQIIKLGFSNNDRINLENASSSDKKLANYLKSEHFLSGRGLFIAKGASSDRSSLLAYIVYRIIKFHGVSAVAGYPELTEYWRSPLDGQIRYLSGWELDRLLNGNTSTKTVTAIRQAANVSYLFIDDFENLKITDHALWRLDNIIDCRSRKHLATFIASSKTLPEMRRKRGMLEICQKLSAMMIALELSELPSQTDLLIPA